MLNIALLGNPNSGKTTVFNELTGSNQYVGNWPGVTVEKKVGKIKGSNISVTDLPGIYSLSPYSLEEVISRDYIINDKPDIILNIVDASNIERNLYLTHQVLDLEVPVIIALNMIDVVEKRGDTIDIEELSKSLNCPVIPISALKGNGINDLVKYIKGYKASEMDKANNISFDERIEEGIESVESILASNGYTSETRWNAIKLLERDEKVLEEVKLANEESKKVDEIRASIEKEFNDDYESISISGRYDYVENLTKKHVTKKSTTGETVSMKIDNIITNRILALPIFFGIMWFVYYISIQTIGDMTIGFVETFMENYVAAPIAGFMEGASVAPWIQSLTIDGIVGGVGAVLGFVPQIMILYLFIGILEDCGYMARVAFIMDRIFRKFGLSGKSFIPMLMGSGCSVPGIMAARTIESDSDRKMTIMLTPFIPCGAKLPVFALMVGAFFPNNTWVAPSMYFVGIGMVIISGLILKNTLFKGKGAPFVMELPDYKVPRLKGVMVRVLERGKSFIMKAGTVIFFASGLIWLLQTFNFSFEMVDANQSMLASIGTFIAPVFAPLGFGTWEASVATVTGFLAKEVVVSTFGVLSGVGEVVESDPSLVGYIGTIFTPLSAYAYMVFTLLAAPCFAAIGAMRREFGGFKWTFIAVAYQTGLAWIVAFLIYQIGSGNFMNVVFGGVLIGLILLAGIKFFKGTKDAGCSSGCSGCNSKCS
ncbi:MAG: ferrous iron transport protein B [Clostridium sp.]|uniref:ferrous iron transport protein B n=1 Tax=Clostridium sp. TaxID=1506 RepID=UPI002FCB392C